MKDCCSANGNKKIMDYIIITVVLVLLIGSFVVGFGLKLNEEGTIKEDLDLEQYRGEGIPIDCRLPTYEKRIGSWKEHLGHHENTLYCLEYFK